MPDAKESARANPSDELGFDADEFEKRVVWIFGSVRSGSTWLLRLLCHPCVLEASDGLGFALRDGRRPTSPLAALPVNEFLLGHHLVPQSGSPIKTSGDRYVPASNSFFWRSGSDYVLSSDYEDVWRAELRRFVLARLHAMVDRAATRYPVADDAAVVIKDVGASHAAQLIMSLLPSSRLLFLTRDGRDVVDSLVHASQPGGWFSRLTGATVSTDEDRLRFIREKAREWACCSDVCEAAWERPPGRASAKAPIRGSARSYAIGI